MIELNRSEQSAPYIKFYSLYDKCINQNQNHPEAIAISTYDQPNQQTDIRYVNLKYIMGDKWIFFTNYNSAKAQQIETHKKISAAIYWDKINIQIRLKGIIEKTSESFSDSHFFKRVDEKNCIAVSSRQSEPISSYNKVVENYKIALTNKDGILKKRPSYWGGYSLIPEVIEFWKGHNSRINERELYVKKNDSWDCKILQP